MALGKPLGPVTLDLSELRWPALTTAACIAVYSWQTASVGSARLRWHVNMPDTTGPPEFNRIFRAHQNTLEQMPSFLSSMWLCSIFVDAKVAAALGSVWVLARIGYARAYRNAQSLGRWTIPCYLVVNSLSALTIIRILRSFL